jgi:hypothetical protein
MSTRIDYSRVAERLGTDRLVTLARHVADIAGTARPTDVRHATTFLEAQDPESVRDALSYLELDDGAFGTAARLFDEALAGRTTRNQPATLLDWRRPSETLEPAEAVRKIIAGGEVHLTAADRLAYQAAALRTIQRLFDNKYRTDGELKHEVGLMQHELRGSDRGDDFASSIFPSSRGDDVLSAQRGALRFVLLTTADGARALTHEAIAKLGEIGGVEDVRFLVEHCRAHAGDQRLFAERAIRAIGNRLGWPEIIDRVRTWDHPKAVDALPFVKELSRLSEMLAELGRHTGGLHSTDLAYFNQREEWIDVATEEGRRAIKDRIAQTVREEQGSGSTTEIERRIHREYREAVAQVFTLRKIEDLPKTVRCSKLATPNGPHKMIAGDPKRKYLFTIDEDGAHFAPEVTPMISRRGCICHTNLTVHPKRAFNAGEARFIGPRELLLGCCSGRYGQDAHAYAATAHFFESLGFKVHIVPFGDFG